MTSSRMATLELASSLYTAVVADILDRRGLRQQVIDASITCQSGRPAVCGFALTVAARPTDALPEGGPYQEQIRATDALKPGDVVVAATADADCAFWGELFSTAAEARGARGAVVDGLVRDVSKMNDIGFTTYARGRKPFDSMGRLTVDSFGDPVEIGGVLVKQGDLVIGDEDGIVVIPHDMIDDVLEEARTKADQEDGMRNALKDGMLLMDAWERFKVL